MQIISCLLYDSVVLIILSLNIIKTEQTVRIKNLENIWSVFVFYKMIFIIILINICKNMYTHILLLSELLVEKKFHSILINFTFHSHVKLIIINKIYLMTDWNQFFHAMYTQLWKLQILLDQKSWFTYIIILNEQIFVIVQQLIKFNNNVKIFHILIN